MRAEFVNPFSVIVDERRDEHHGSARTKTGAPQEKRVMMSPER